MLARAPAENGVSAELEQMEQEFTRQRAALSAGRESFVAWRQHWDARTRDIDRALQQLRERLTPLPEPLASLRVKRP